MNIDQLLSALKSLDPHALGQYAGQILESSATIMTVGALALGAIFLRMMGTAAMLLVAAAGVAHYKGWIDLGGVYTSIKGMLPL